jgi:hypothetical protein
MVNQLPAAIARINPVFLPKFSDTFNSVNQAEL